MQAENSYAEVNSRLVKKTRQIYWKPQHEVFIRGMLAHGDKIRAYCEAYPRISPAAVRQAAGRLLSCPHIRQRIEAVVSAAGEAVIKELEEKAKDRIREQMMTVHEKRKFLAAIVSGRIRLHRAIRLKDRVMEIETDLDPYVIIRAIELDSKLETGYPWRTNQEVIDRGINRLIHYLSSSNNQGVGVYKQFETDWAPNPLQDSISYFAHVPFVNTKPGLNRQLMTNKRLNPASNIAAAVQGNQLIKVIPVEGVGVCKQFETNSPSNPPQQSISYFAHVPFVNTKPRKMTSLVTNEYHSKSSLIHRTSIRLINLHRSGIVVNNQGVAVCKPIETNSLPNPPRENISCFDNKPVVNKKRNKMVRLITNKNALHNIPHRAACKGKSANQEHPGRQTR